MKVYLVNETVDLGYHVAESYFSKDQASSRCEFLNSAYRTKQIIILVNNGYIESSPVIQAELLHNYYFVEEIEVI